MPKEDRNILKYNHGKKSTKITFIIYADMESLLDKTDTIVIDAIEILKCHQQLK